MLLAAKSHHLIPVGGNPIGFEDTRPSDGLILGVIVLTSALAESGEGGDEDKSVLNRSPRNSFGKDT